MRWALLAASTAVLLAACSSSTTDGNGAPPSGSAFAEACEQAKSRASTCGPKHDKSIEQVGADDCEQIDGCYDKVFRAPLGIEVARCITKRPCHDGWGKCWDTVSEAHAGDEGVAALVAACQTAAKRCNTPTNVHVSRCQVAALVTDGAAWTKCHEGKCEDVGRCLDPLFPVCDR
ncbi:MAG: hypothetical protein KF819_26515 [Labilithrix sp.]|nr:hypothetical protein [Labilithrix sp.]